MRGFFGDIDTYGGMLCNTFRRHSRKALLVQILLGPIAFSRHFLGIKVLPFLVVVYDSLPCWRCWTAKAALFDPNLDYGISPIKPDQHAVTDIKTTRNLPR